MKVKAFALPRDREGFNILPLIGWSWAGFYKNTLWFAWGVWVGGFQFTI